MDTSIKIRTSHRMHLNGRDTAPGAEVSVLPATALDVLNARRGELVDPGDAQRLRAWATAQGVRRDFSNFR